MEGNQGEESHSALKGPHPSQWYVVSLPPCHQSQVGLTEPTFLGAMELRIIKPSLKYVPGQWLFIQVPDVSRYQWHPVSRSSPSSYVRIDLVYASVLVYDHLSARRPLRFCPHPSGWRLDSGSWRAPRSGTVSRCCPHLSCDERLRERELHRPWGFRRNRSCRRESRTAGC